MMVEFLFPFLFRRGHGLGDIDAATLQHVEQRARFGAFGIGERGAGLVLRHEQLDHALVWSEFIFKETLLLLGGARDLSAKGLNSANGLFKGLTSRAELVEGAMSAACYGLSAPERIGISELFSKNAGAAGEI